MTDNFVIRNAKICDGSGAPWYWGELSVRGNSIAEVGRSVNVPDGADIFDAAGLMLTPGFIDIHSHADFGLLTDPAAENLLVQGVTTIIIGQCGLSPAPICPERIQELDEYCGVSKSGKKIDWNWNTFGQWLARLDRQPLGLNVGAFIGQGTVRLCVMGFDPRTPTQQELEKMRQLVEQSMDEGAFGMSSGLAYPPGIYSSDSELEFVAGGLTKRHGLYLSHMRNQSTKSPECVRATINVGRVNHIPVQVVHLKAREADHKDMAELLFSIMNEARTEGIDVTVDQYPYTAASSNMRSMMPAWVHAHGVKGIMELLSDPGRRKALYAEMEASDRWQSSLAHGNGPTGIIFGDLPFSPEYSGKNLQTVADTMKTTPLDALLEIILRNQGCDHGVYFTMTEQDIRKVMVNPLVMVGSDGGITAPGSHVHPRLCGTFPRLLGRYARELKMFPMEEGVRKMTSLTASRLGLTHKGMLRPGMDADLVLFDPDTIADGNTYEEPTNPPVGIFAVWVDGQLAVQAGTVTGASNGRVLRYGQN